MFLGIIARAEEATAWVGRYCDLERAARLRNYALVIGTAGWAGRWVLVGFLATDFVATETAAVETLTQAAQGGGAQKTAFYIGAILLCMAIKWAGWTYGGVGYVHHRRTVRAALSGHNPLVSGRAPV